MEWKPWKHDSQYLLGYCAIAFPGGWVVHSVPVFKSRDGTLSVGVPSAAQIDPDGRVKVRAGKRQYSAMLTFQHGGARERWRRTVLAALVDAGIVP